MRGIISCVDNASPDERGRDRWRLAAAMMVILGLVGGGIVLMRDDGERHFNSCPSDGLTGPGGTLYGRDPDKGCKFVDEDGNTITTTVNGCTLYYDDYAVAFSDC